MLRRLSGHREVLLEAGGKNCYPAEGVAPGSSLLLLTAVEFLEQQQDAAQAEWAQGGAPRSRWKKLLPN